MPAMNSLIESIDRLLANKQERQEAGGNAPMTEARIGRLNAELGSTVHGFIDQAVRAIGGTVDDVTVSVFPSDREIQLLILIVDPTALTEGPVRAELERSLGQMKADELDVSGSPGDFLVTVTWEL
jgi:hypothetical protein